MYLKVFQMMMPLQAANAFLITKLLPVLSKLNIKSGADG